MKDKRNCNNNMNYPIYPQPMMIPPMGYQNPQAFQSFQTFPNYNSDISNNNYEQQFNSIEQKINNLEQRITRLERQYLNNNSNNNYNDSNYYMV